jgi:hypothetical protein
MPEQVHQRAGQQDQERQQLQQVLVVAKEQPPDGRCQAEPEQPLVDARPVRSVRQIAVMVMEGTHDVTP